MQQRVVDEVGDHLAERPGIAVHADRVGHVHLDVVVGRADPVHHGGDDFVAHLLQVEEAALLGGAVDRDLLEAVDQVGRAGQPAHHQPGRLLRVGHEGGQLRAAQAGAVHQHFDLGGFFLHGRGDQQAVADRGVQFVRHARHQRAERGQLFLRHQLRLRVLQLAVGAGVVERDGAVGAQRAENQALALAVGARAAATAPSSRRCARSPTISGTNSGAHGWAGARDQLRCRSRASARCRFRAARAAQRTELALRVGQRRCASAAAAVPASTPNAQRSDGAVRVGQVDGEGGWRRAGRARGGRARGTRAAASRWVVISWPIARQVFERGAGAAAALRRAALRLRPARGGARPRSARARSGGAPASRRRGWSLPGCGSFRARRRAGQRHLVGALRSRPRRRIRAPARRAGRPARCSRRWWRPRASACCR